MSRLTKMQDSKNKVTGVSIPLDSKFLLENKKEREMGWRKGDLGQHRFSGQKKKRNGNKSEVWCLIFHSRWRSFRKLVKKKTFTNLSNSTHFVWLARWPKQRKAQAKRNRACFYVENMEGFEFKKQQRGKKKPKRYHTWVRFPRSTITMFSLPSSCPLPPSSLHLPESFFFEKETVTPSQRSVSTPLPFPPLPHTSTPIWHVL